jgi:predicted MFS family arabinose efflux permease
MRESTSETAGTGRLILVLAVCGFASSFAIRSLDPLIGVVARDLQSDPHTIALLATAFAIPYAFIQPVLGPVGDALGKVRVMRVCLAVLAAALTLSALAHNTPMLFALRMASGAAAGGVIPLSLATIGDRVPMSGRQIALSRFLVALIIGQLSGATLSGFLAPILGWRGVILLAGAIGLAGFAASTLGLTTTKAVPPAGFDPAVALARYRAIIAIPRARALFAFVFVEGIIIFGVFPYIAPLLEARGAGGPSEAGIIVAAFAAGGILYSALVALMLRTLGLAWMLVAAGISGLVGFMGIAAASHWSLEAVAMIALGLSFYCLHNSFQTQVTEVAPQARGSAVALHAFSFFGGQAIGPVALGFGFNAVGEAPTLLVGAVAMLALGVVAAWVLAPAQLRAR